MIIELGNHLPLRAPIDGRPCVTTIHIPEHDTGATHPDAVYENGRHPVADGPEPKGTLVKPGPPRGGYDHVIGGITVPDFKLEYAEAIYERKRIFHLEGHEMLLAAIESWKSQSKGKPRWINVIPHEPDGKRQKTSTPDGTADDIRAFLEEFWNIKQEKPGNFEDIYHTPAGPPGKGWVDPPAFTAMFLNTGRVQQAINYGGGQVGTSGTATSTGSTSLGDSGASWTAHQWAGYRIYAGGVWANILDNTSTGLTLDRWYAPATPGGSAGSTPSGTTEYIIADGGVVSAWFMGLSTSTTPSAGDTTMATEYNVGGGGYNRKICPYTLTSGTSPMTYTLVPVYTGNGSDTYSTTFDMMGCFHGMIVTGTSPYTPMKFETQLNAPATVSASGDMVTVTETVTGS